MIGLVSVMQDFTNGFKEKFLQKPVVSTSSPVPRTVECPLHRVEYSWSPRVSLQEKKMISQ